MENAPLFAGSKMTTGPIGICQICQNKAELHGIPNDERNMCEECAEVMLAGRNKKQEMVQATPRPVFQSVQQVPMSDEKALYLYTIRSKIKTEQIGAAIEELIDKKVFEYDFMRIIENERWFSLMDLRRLALKVDPFFERAIEEPAQMEPVLSKPTKVRNKHAR
jgi:hypothetical protein